MQTPSDDVLAKALVAWVDAYPVQTGTYQDFWERLCTENRAFFDRLEAPGASAVLSAGYTEAMARAEDDGLMRRPLYVPATARIRRPQVDDPAVLAGVIARFETEARAAWLAVPADEREDRFAEQADLLACEVAPALQPLLAEHLAGLASRLGIE